MVAVLLVWVVVDVDAWDEFEEEVIVTLVEVVVVALVVFDVVTFTYKILLLDDKVGR